MFGRGDGSDSVPCASVPLRLLLLVVVVVEVVQNDLCIEGLFHPGFARDEYGLVSGGGGSERGVVR